MGDIGFKNSSNSDRNEGPPPPPDWNQVVVDGPPPAWNTIGDEGLKTCYEVTLIYMSVLVSKKTKEWEVQSDMGKNKPTLSDHVIQAKFKLGYRWLPSLYTPTLTSSGEFAKYKIDDRNPGSIIKLCVCATSTQIWAAKIYLFGLGIGTKASKCKWTFVPGPVGSTHRRYVYRCAKVKISCEGCLTKGCWCRNAKSINLTNINNKSKKYTDSNGNNVTLTNPGDYKKVIEQIVAAEDKIGLDCE